MDKDFSNLKDALNKLNTCNWKITLNGVELGDSIHDISTEEEADITPESLTAKFCVLTNRLLDEEPDDPAMIREIRENIQFILK